ncbi:lysine--tRNA ligase [Patescibacteria group bacterium]|nr:lysine--tRNA ligase [Patescibacteria group bacterium]MCL5409668.1 lysine--tRNA ligase [Patescibacteria group bacterium]
MAENNLQKERIKKLQNIKKLGINPYPSQSNRKQTAAEARDMLGRAVTVAGRLKSLRPHGKITFADLEDLSGKIQLLFSQEELKGEKYDFLGNLDIGDFLQAEGEVFTTQAGEITVRVKEYKLLTKTIKPIPANWFGLKDIETRLRKRYLDLIVNSTEKDLFIKKAKFWTAVREFLIKEGFFEVETPALEPIAGGADARPFITHHHALDRDLYLRISLELYQKRLLVGGLEKIFEIGKVFRNEGIDAEHLQDYLQMEFYWAYANYQDLMVLIQKMYQYLVKETVESLQTSYQGKTIDWGGDWPKIDYVEEFKKVTGIDLDGEVGVQELIKFAKEHKIPIEDNLGKGRLIDSIYKKLIRPKLISPCFLINHPVDVSPLAKRMEGNPKRVERMQVLVGGTEVGNGFSELNDPIDQLNRFKEQQALRKQGDEEAQMLDEDFVESLEYGMPPAAGFGMSQRLFAIIIDRPIRETVAFPTMKDVEVKTDEQKLKVHTITPQVELETENNG